MPFRNLHSCVIDSEVTEITDIEEVKTSWGVIQRVFGKDPAGKRKQRGIRIPASVPIRVAYRLCKSCGGDFEPATPRSSRKELLNEVGGMTLEDALEVLDKLIRRFNLSEVRLAEWDTAYINALPDSAFALILPGGKKDSEGKTVPRSKRKLPYKDKDGKIDKAHLRNALARVNQASAPANLKQAALKKLLRVAKSVGIETQKQDKYKLEELDRLFKIKNELEVLGNAS